MPVFNAYVHKPLTQKDAIKLVVLEPSATATAPLSCHIVEYWRSARTLEYSAVSYVWGTDKPTENLEIKCDGDVKYLRITAHVETVLKGLRRNDRSQYLWLDTISFNQHDEAERAQHIPLMGDIYKTAAAVDIWLGPEHRTTARFIAFFRKLSRLPKVTEYKSQREFAGRIAFYMKKFFLQDTHAALKAVLDFFSLPWFTRRWIIQEASLANRGIVHCGKQSIDLDSLRCAATNFQRMDLSDFAIKVAANLGPETTKLSMLELLWHFHDSTCLDPKDRIAAFLGLAQDTQDFDLDYTKPYESIFKDFALFACSRGCKDTRLQLLLHLFEFGPIVKKEDISYLSWVPDWSRSRRRKLPYIKAAKNIDTYEPYPKFPGLSEKAYMNFHDGLLHIQAKIAVANAQAFQVATTATFRCSETTESLKEQQLYGIRQALFPSVPEAKLHITAFAILLKTISEFRHPIVKRESTSKSLGDFEVKLRKSLPEMDYARLSTWLRTLDSVLRKFHLVELRCCNQNLKKVDGYGIGCESLQVGDIVIPLWNLPADQDEPDLRPATLDTNIQISTMLVVRRTNDLFVNEPLVPGLAQQYKIVGPLTCVTWTQSPSDSRSPSDRGPDPNDEKQCLLIRIR